MKRLIIIVAAVILSACGYDSFDKFTTSDFPTTGSFANTDLSYLVDNYFGKPVVIVEDLVFDGYVISTDKSGNFFRSFIIDDGTAAVEIRAGVYDLANVYQPGRRVVVRAKGLSVGKYNGVIQLGIGINSYTDFRVEEFGSFAILDKFIERDAVFREERPMVRVISDLTPEDCGRVVRIDDVIVDSEYPQYWAAGTGDFTSTASVRFKDEHGEQLLVVTSAYADFATQQVPTGRVSLTGILMYGKFNTSNNSYALKMRTIDDVI